MSYRKTLHPKVLAVAIAAAPLMGLSGYVHAQENASSSSSAAVEEVEGGGGHRVALPRLVYGQHMGTQ